MTAHVFIEKFSQEITYSPPLLILPIIFLLLWSISAYALVRSSTSNSEAKKYKHDSLTDLSSLTKVGLELVQLEKAVAR